jgi:hypothetical protein
MLRVEGAIEMSTKWKKHTITQLFKKGTIHAILSASELKIVLCSIGEAFPSATAARTYWTAIEQTTQIGVDEFTLPQPVLTRIVGQLEDRWKRQSPLASDDEARAICRNFDAATLTGPEVVRRKATYLASLINTEATDGAQDENH